MRRSLLLTFVAGVLALSACGNDRSERGDDGRAPRGAQSVAARFEGIPQRGAALGEPGAPFTLVEFADLQCPYCAVFDRDVLPAVIERFVRPGRLRLELRPVSFLGEQSAPAAAATVAAGMQNRMWQFADLFFRNQGRENSGYVTPQFLGRIAQTVPGLDFERFQQASDSDELVAELKANASAARTAAIRGTPGFRLGRTGGPLTPFDPSALERTRFIAELRAAIAAARR